MTKLLKIALITGAIGGVSGGAYIIYNSLSGRNNNIPTSNESSYMEDIEDEEILSWEVVWRKNKNEKYMCDNSEKNKEDLELQGDKRYSCDTKWSKKISEDLKQKAKLLIRGEEDSVNEMLQKLSTLGSDFVEFEKKGINHQSKSSLGIQRFGDRCKVKKSIKRQVLITC